MKLLIPSSLAVVAAFLQHPVNHDIVSEIQKTASWKPMDPSKNPLSRVSKDEIMGMMGTILAPVPASALDRFNANHSAGTKVGFPDSFDARSEFGSCMHPIRDQAKCGSCWAFGAAETLSDNLCAAGSPAGVLSPQDLVSCDSVDHGCNGGTLPSAWDYLQNTGIVSDACLPYTAYNGTVDACPPGQCTGSGSYAKHRCPSKPNFLSSKEDIKQGVMSLGAAETGFYVYEDFLSYSGGIYKHATGQVLGGHAVKIIGWGHSGETEYWIVANSWGTSWGESGYFRIDMSDRDSAFALGGAFNCGDLEPVAPTPAPPTPYTCEDISSTCADHTSMCDKGLVGVCLRTCGCCVTYNKPDYCPK